MTKKKVIIVGSGISGLSTAYYLYKKFNVKIFEQNEYLGGHTHTHTIKINQELVNVDSGFIVFNNFNYKNFIQFIQKLKIKYQISNMSFSVTNRQKKYEWSGKNFKSIFLSKNSLTLRYWRVLKDIFKFNKLTKQYINSEIASKETVSQFLSSNKFSKEFLDFYFYPMCASIWSNPVGKIKNFKIHFILSFFSNHGLINIIKKRPIWYTISNGSKSYVEKIFKLVGEKNFIHEKVLKINQQKKYIITSKGRKYKFDHAIIATHTDNAKKILGKITLDQKKLLNMVKYRGNTAIMHTDTSVMPKNKNNWSSWNFLNRKKNFALTYWMNLLQNLTIDKNIFVSINCDDKIEKNKIIKKIKYSHPVFSNKTQDIKNKLNEVQGVNGVWFAGAWQGYGFHEDGLKSALRIVKKIR